MPSLVSSLSNNLDLIQAKNVDFSGQPIAADTMISDGQLLIAHNALNINGSHIDVGNITSSTLKVGYVNPNITINTFGGGQPIEQITVENSTPLGVNPVLPTATGNITIKGGQVVNSSLAGVIQTHSFDPNEFTITIQRSAVSGTPDITKNGVSHFDSAAFDVDGNGFVQLNGGGIAITSIDVDAHTAPGTDPVVPTAAGQITITGAQVATGTIGANVIRTDSLAANTFTIEIQRSTAVAATDSTKNGVAHFDSTSFTVDANGFVQSVGGGFTWTDVSGAFSPKKNNGYFIIGTSTATLPAAPAQGDTIQFFVDHASQLLTITANTGQIIRMGSLVSSTAGTWTSTLQGDSCELVYRAVDTCWCAVDFVGTWVKT